MKYIKVNPRMRYTGEEGSPWITTYELLSLFVRSSRSLNMGLNVFEGKAIIDMCFECKEEKRGYIDIEDSQYKLLMEDLKGMDFLSLGLSSVIVVEDVRNIQNAVDKQPEDFDAVMEYLYPDPKTLPEVARKAVPEGAKIFEDVVNKRRSKRE